MTIIPTILTRFSALDTTGTNIHLSTTVTVETTINNIGPLLKPHLRIQHDLMP